MNLDPTTWGPALFAAMSSAVNQSLIDLAMTLIQNLQMVLLHPPSLEGVGFVAVLYGNAKGVIPSLAFAASFFALIFSIVWQRKTKSLIVVIPIAVAVILGNAIWFENAHILTDIGHKITEAMNFFKPASSTGNVMDLPGLANIPLSMIGAVSISLGTALLWLVMLLFAILNVSMVFWLPLVISFYGLSAGAAKFVKVTISIMLVSMLYGPGAAMFIINLAKSMTAIPGFDAVILTYGLLVIGVWLALAIQPVLVWLTYKGVSLAISRISGSSRVSGKVQTENKDIVDVNVAKFNDQHAVSMRGGIGGASQPSQYQLSRTEAAVLEQKKRAIAYGTKVAQGLAVKSGVGAFGLGAINAGEKIITARTEDKAERKSRARQEEEVSRG